MTLTLDLALAGLGIGSVAALSGLGVIVTYRLTGVFNLAFGAIAMIVTYLFWYEVNRWHWSVVAAAMFDLLVVCPVGGAVIERGIFRPLGRRNASPAEHLVASLGLLVVLLGTAVVLWGMQARLDVPSIVGSGQFRLGGHTRLPVATVVDVLVVVGVAAALALGQRTPAGLRVRAVVDDRTLAQLQGIKATRVTALGWMIGTTLAGLAGILLAPTVRLQPYGFTLVMLETMAVVVIARLVDPIRAVLAGLLIGVAQAELAQVHLTGRARPLVEALNANLFVVVLLIAVLVLRQLDRSNAPGDMGTTSRLSARGSASHAAGWWVWPTMLLASPLLFRASDLRSAVAVPALAVVLVSTVVVSGYSGLISLGQAGFAGLGALVAAHVAAGSLPWFPRLPGFVALVVAPLLVVPVGLVLGRPAIRHRGLFLALTTFALSVALSRFVFDQPNVTSGLVVSPPTGFGSDTNFYVLELVGLAGALALVRNLHHGRLGRALLAVRDDEAGAAACGVDVPHLKLTVFATGAALAAFGGALAAMGAHAFDPSAFDPIRGLLWFAAVVVFGIDSAAGAVLAAGVLVALDTALPAGTSIVAIGVGALAIGHLPGGLMVAVRGVLGTRAAASPNHDDTPSQQCLTPAGRAVVNAIRSRSTAQQTAP